MDLGGWNLKGGSGVGRGWVGEESAITPSLSSLNPSKPSHPCFALRTYVWCLCGCVGGGQVTVRHPRVVACRWGVDGGRLVAVGSGW